MTDDTQN